MPSIDRSTLRANCADCFALCCTAFGFQRSADFPIDKPAGTPCSNLTGDFACGIHPSLRARGFRGCTVFDCFGAGQFVSQNLFAGTSWRDRAETTTDMFASFAVARQLHEMLWYLAEAAEHTTTDAAAPASLLRNSIRQALDGGTAAVLTTDVEQLRTDVRHLLIEVSEEVRGGYGPVDASLRPAADLVGRDLRGARLCGADLRGAYLIAADFRECDLSGVDLLGADLRDARLDGADLSRSLFLTQAQVNAAMGDAATLLPAALDRPEHWAALSKGVAGRG